MFSILLFLLPSCIALSQKPLTHTTSRKLLEKKAFVNLTHSLLARYHVAGLSISLLHNDDVTAKGYGYAALPDVTATPETLWYTASTTKSFTAAALSILMDDFANTTNAFAWNTPVSQLIHGDFLLSDIYVTNHVTLEDFASHRSGLAENGMGYGGSDVSLHEMVSELRGLPLSKPFRTTFQYCNRGWVVLSYVAETLSEKWLGTLIRERIWEPLRMRRTYFGLREALEANVTIAQGYTWDSASKTQLPIPHFDFPEISGAGIMVSNVLDYSRYLKMMLARAKPLSEEAHKQLRTPRAVADEEELNPFNEPMTYSLGWFITTYRDVTIYFHTGSLPGVGVLMAFVPSLNLGVTMMSNNQVYGKHVEFILLAALIDDILGSPSTIGADMIAAIDEEDKKAEEASKHILETLYPSIPDPPLPYTLPLEAYQGTYVPAPGYQNLTFTVANQSSNTPGADFTRKVLRAEAWHRTWPHAIELEHVSGEHFVAWFMILEQFPGLATQGERAEFRIGAQGEVVELGIKMERSLVDLVWFKHAV